MSSSKRPAIASHRAGRVRPASASPRRDIRRQRLVAGVPDPTGPFAWSVAWGGLVFISGIRGIDPATRAPAADDRGRVRLIFEHLSRILEASGCGAQDVLATRVYVTDMSRHRRLVNEAYTRFFGTTLPTRTIVEVRALNQADTIEVEVVAARRNGA
jgi:2-iminobutanoate/2-iminopropanoate deaminase